MADTPKDLKTFAEFWPFYLGEHADPTNRVLHFVGSSLALLWLGLAIYWKAPTLLLAALVNGYAFAWIGHFFVEKNRPATFTYPLKSFLADWVMFFYILTGQINKELERLQISPPKR